LCNLRWSVAMLDVMRDEESSEIDRHLTDELGDEALDRASDPSLASGWLSRRA
jgi:hypothetical protein